MEKLKYKIMTVRHSLAHILACAVQELYPGVKFGVGPDIENGFYYDFDFSKIKIANSKQNLNLSLSDLPKIKKKMKQLIKQNIKFIKKSVSINEAKKIFKNQPYKLELIKKIIKQDKNAKIYIYEFADFIDLCHGPHIKSAKDIDINSFKINKIAGAYWQGDEKNPMLTRIYGIAFDNEKDLKDYIIQQEEAKKRDHRVLGQKLELFTISEDVGQGLPLWLPKGAMLRQIIEDFVLKKYIKEGYQLVRTPHIGREKLFKKSGHLEHYKDDMYTPLKIDAERYYLKPMNCPFHLVIYNNTPKSYRDLPIRYTELGAVYRYERSGTLHGLTRVRGFTQDDGHIFCTPEQLDKEIANAIKLTKNILQTFGFKKIKVFLSVRDSKNKKKYLGTDSDWLKAEQALIYGIKKAKWDFVREQGEAVFYGPKIDVKIEDAIGRKWQLSTLQLDFNLPERFDIFYIDKKGERKRPFMLHRALLGSLERFIGVLIEHYAGAFPLWLSPIQICVIPISEKNNKYAEQIFKQLNENDFRCELKKENETLGKKIRQAQIEKTPYILIIGDKEQKSKSISVRERSKGDIGTMKLNKFIEIAQKEINDRI